MKASNSSATDPTFLLHMVGMGKIKPESCSIVCRAAQKRLPKSRCSLLLAYVSSKRLFPSFSWGSSPREVACERPTGTCATCLVGGWTLNTRAVKCMRKKNLALNWNVSYQDLCLLGGVSGNWFNVMTVNGNDCCLLV